MNKKILTLSVLSLLLFSMFLGFVDAAEKVYDKKVNSDCERGLIGPWLMGTSCGPGLVCNTENKCEVGSNININIKGKVPKFLEGLLNSGKNGAVYDRLIIFVLVVAVVFGALGSVNIFGGEDQPGKGTLINLIISVTVGLAGVRFLPENLISSITAPATAMVSLITAGLPFLIIHIMTSKLITNDQQPSSKVKTIWIIYLLLICGLIFNSIRNLPAGPQRMIPFIVLGCFVILAIIEFIVTPLRIRRSQDNKMKRITERGELSVKRAHTAAVLSKQAQEMDKAKLEIENSGAKSKTIKRLVKKLKKY